MVFNAQKSSFISNELNPILVARMQCDPSDVEEMQCQEAEWS